MTKKQLTLWCIFFGVYCGVMWLSGFITGYDVHGGEFFGECFRDLKRWINKNK